jgi:hypothetical protein
MVNIEKQMLTLQIAASIAVHRSANALFYGAGLTSSERLRYRTAAETGTNWNFGVIPTPADDVFVNNGFTAVLSSASSVLRLDIAGPEKAALKPLVSMVEDVSFNTTFIGLVRFDPITWSVPPPRLKVAEQMPDEAPETVIPPDGEAAQTDPSSEHASLTRQPACRHIFCEPGIFQRHGIPQKN